MKGQEQIPGLEIPHPEHQEPLPKSHSMNRHGRQSSTAGSVHRHGPRQRRVFVGVLETILETQEKEDKEVINAAIEDMILDFVYRKIVRIMLQSSVLDVTEVGGGDTDT